MAFNSLIFLVFVSLFFAFWNLVKKNNHPKWVYITVMSLFFYGWWDWRFIFLILFSGALDFYSSLWMAKFPERKKVWLAISLIGNLGSLCFFKYSYFVQDTINQLLSLFYIDFRLSAPRFSIVLPVGISFYTFQSLSYTIDVYRGKLRPASNIFHFFSYLALFPQLVAGPIVRAKNLLQQLAEERHVSSTMKYNAWKLVAYGYFQKTVIADNLGYMVDSVFGGKTIYEGAILWWVTIVAFSFQIYFDFSGYSLIARGLAKMMGLHFRMNFNHPYFAPGFKDFWSRWHISLSTWFRDYVYIPLGGNRKGFMYSVLFMSVTMVLSGIWHGARWTFVIWGLLHAVYLAAERISNRANINLRQTYPWLGWVVTYLLLLVSWFFFRAESMDQVQRIFLELYVGKYDWSFFRFFINAEVFLLVAILVEVYVFIKRQNNKFRSVTKVPAIEMFKIPIALACSIFLRGPSDSFIYFQF